MAPVAGGRHDQGGSGRPGDVAGRAGDASAGAWRERPMTIGRVIEQLRPEFPDVSPSKIRFLETEGLVTPGRTPAGYRTYAAGDVDRLRFVLSAQRDRYWPLKVIREALHANANPDADADPAARSDSAAAPTATLIAAPTPAPAQRDRRALTAAELGDQAGISRDLLRSLEEFGMVRPDRFSRYDSHALAVASAAGRLAGHGLEPRHLRAFRAAADREVGLVEQVVATRRGDETREQRAADVADACIELHSALVHAALVHVGPRP